MKSRSFKFTKEAIAKLLLPTKGREIYKDTKEHGLILMVYYTGKKTFYIAQNIKTDSGKDYYRGKIGDFPYLSIASARAKVVEFKTQVANGFNPFAKLPAAPKEMTFKQLVDKYITDYAQHKIKRWKYIINDMDRQSKSLYNMGISTIQKSDIIKIFDYLSRNTGKTTANRFVARMSSIFNQAIEWELLEKNPATRIKKHRENERDRYITAEEVDRFFEAVEAEKNPVMRDFILIALYTGIRKSNVMSLRWKDISFINRTCYLKDTKNGDSQHVALPDEAIEILEERHKTANSDWVFPSENSASGHIEEPQKAMARIKKRAGLENLTIHDLRRTKGSWMAIAGASTYVIGKALNHKSPRSTAIYARLSLDPVREYTKKANSVFTQNRIRKKNIDIDNFEVKSLVS
jgi:integrase